jgi:hypothetical protein
MFFGNRICYKNRRTYQFDSVKPNAQAEPELLGSYEYYNIIHEISSTWNLLVHINTIYYYS